MLPGLAIWKFQIIPWEGSAGPRAPPNLPNYVVLDSGAQCNNDE
jgi:hypothetical protein